MSKKLIIIRIICVVAIIVFLAFIVFLFVRCNVIGTILSEPRSYVRENNFTISTESTAKKYLDKADKKEEAKETKKIDTLQKKNEVKDENNNKPWWSSFKSILTGVSNFITNIVSSNDTLSNAVIKKKTENSNARKIQKLFDDKFLEKDMWHIIDDDNDGYGYNYYFDDKGLLLTDSVTYDYRIVDVNGRELDDELAPIIYKVSTASNVVETVEETTKKPSDVIYSPGVQIKNKSKAYDNTMDKNMLLYIRNSVDFRKTTNGTIYNGSKWRGVSSLKDDGSHVVFYNPDNNFNKVTGYITTQEVTNGDTSTRCSLYVYDYATYYKDKDDPIYYTDDFNYGEPLRFSFTFNRTVNELIFYVATDNGDSKKRLCYLKNLRFGFSNKAYADELEEKKNEEDYINLLKELGIYKEITDLQDENGNIEDEPDYYLEDYEYVEYEDIDLIDKDYRTNEEKARDRVTGPAFDEELKKEKTWRDSGPAFDTSLNITTDETTIGPN